MPAWVTAVLQGRKGIFTRNSAPGHSGRAEGQEQAGRQRTGPGPEPFGALEGRGCGWSEEWSAQGCQDLEGVSLGGDKPGRLPGEGGVLRAMTSDDTPLP